MKDLSKEIIGELVTRLRSDKVSCDQFYRSFGLETLERKASHYAAFGEIVNIGKLFPDTPVKLVIDVCRALQFYDLVELLENATKPRTLRPAMPLNEITRSLSSRNRPTTFYSKFKIVFVGYEENTFVTIRNCFQKICPGSEICRIPLGIFLQESEEEVLWVQRNVSEAMMQENLRKLQNDIEEKLKVNANLQAQKKKLEADTFDKLWNEERGKIFISYIC